MGLLSVTLVNGSKLLPVESDGQCELYCVLQVGRECLSSAPVRTVSPEWNQQFMFSVSKPDKDVLVILVYDVCVYYHLLLYLLTNTLSI